MAAPFASDESVIEDRWRPLTAAEQTVALTLLDDAAAILLARIPSITERYAAETLSEALVQQVQVAMVLRVLKNPDGKRQESIDDYSWTRDNAVSAGLLYVTSEELSLLRATTRRSLWTQPTTRDNYGTTDGEWVPVEGSDNPFPWYADATEPWV